MQPLARARVCRGILRRIMPAPVRARHFEYSQVYSEDDALSCASDRLMDLALAAIASARQVRLPDVERRLQRRFRFPDRIVNLWPGEHYRLLAGLVEVMRPKLVVEIGTAEGISALAMKSRLPVDGRIVTFDLIPWSDYPNTCLLWDDFQDERLEQIVKNLSENFWFQCYSDLLARADFIFLDAAKDGVLEPRLLSLLGSLKFAHDPVIVMDDIRVWNMLAVWRSIRWPKLDLTSFGHWTGTGLCLLSQP